MEGRGGPEDVEDSQKSQKQQISCEILKMLKNFPKFLGWVFPDVAHILRRALNSVFML